MNGVRLSSTLLLCLFTPMAFAQKPATANQVFENAKVQAAEQHKAIFLVFGSSWCGPCHSLDAFLTAPETRSILEKYVVSAKLNILEQLGHHAELETPGGKDLAVKLGLANAGVPFLVFVDPNGKPIVNSCRPVKGQRGCANIGYPAVPEEIDWFMAMLKKAAPTMTVKELRTIDEWLRKASA